MNIFKKMPPLLPILCSLIAGICSQIIFSISLYLLVPLILITIILIYPLRQNHYIVVLYIISAFLAGSIRTEQKKHNYEHFYTLTQEQPFSLVGRVTEISPAPSGPLRSCITISTHAIQPHNSQWINQTYNLRIYTNTTSVMIDDIVLLENLTCTQTTNTNFARYLTKEGIAGFIFAPKITYTIKEHPNYSLSRWIQFKKNLLLRQCTIKLGKKTSTLFASLFLGEKHRHKKELEPMAEQFKAWGLSHYLARSGLHLVIFILLWQWLLSYIPMSFFIKQLILLILSCIYFLLSWPSISFMRALSTFTIIKLSTYFNKQIHIAHLLIFVCCTILFINPLQLFFLDFQLSFALTFALIWFNYIFHKKQPLQS